ncbi:MAG: type I-E CRISPR-associated protein Cas6/Cse3/CasE [Candidatus Scalindua sp.]
MKYLSQIVIDKKEAIGKGFRDSYAWHKALWEAFPGQDGESRNFLSRINSKDRYYHVLLLSYQRPTLPDWGKWETKEVTGQFLDHEMYKFELRANPTVKRVVRDTEHKRKKNGRRTAICDYMELKEWMKNKALSAGFEIKDDLLEISSPVKDVFVRKGKMGKHSRVDYSGILKVNNRELFRKAFADGIGPAKSFNFGMLVLQPVKEL